jgi:hypothetical protein
LCIARAVGRRLFCGGRHAPSLRFAGALGAGPAIRAVFARAPVLLCLRDER